VCVREMNKVCMKDRGTKLREREKVEQSVYERERRTKLER